MARIIGEARRERHRERVLQALLVCEGWLSVTQIHAAAFGGDSVTAAERDDALDALEAAAIIEWREVARMVGRHGRKSRQYRYVSVDDVINSATTLGAVLSHEPCEHERMSLDTGDRLALLDLALGIVTLLAETA